MMASSPMIGRVSRASSGCTSRPRPALSTRVNDRMRCGSASASRSAIAPPAECPTRSSGGSMSRVSRNAATNGAMVAAGGVVADGRGGFAVAGQAQREHPVGAGQGGDDPPPAGGALLVPVQQQQRRPGTGLQVLGVHPVHGDPTVVDGELVLVLRGRGWGRTDDAVEMTDMKASWCAVWWCWAASPGAGVTAKRRAHGRIAAILAR